ncbi:hypothetical protein SUGI_0258550 [Cryptomeria japonica]|nr:hypothetical protein SUGI_0258550 [Cryptomeria japonica]
MPLLLVKVHDLAYLPMLGVSRFNALGCFKLNKLNMEVNERNPQGLPTQGLGSTHRSKKPPSEYFLGLQAQNTQFLEESGLTLTTLISDLIFFR